MCSTSSSDNSAQRRRFSGVLLVGLVFLVPWPAWCALAVEDDGVLRPDSSIGLGCLKDAVIVPTTGGEGSGSYVATCSESAVHLWRMNGSLVSSLSCTGVSSFSGLAASPDGSMLAVSDTDGQVLVLRVSDLSVVGQASHSYSGYSYPGSSSQVTHRPLAFSPDGSQIALGWIGFTAYIYNTTNWILDTSMGVEPWGNEVLGVEWSPDGSLFLVSGIYTTVFNTSSERPLYELTERLHSSFSPTKDLLASTYLSQVEIYQASNGSMRTSIGLGSPLLVSLVSLAWSPDGQLLAVGTMDGRVIVMEPSGSVVANLSVSVSGEPITALSWKGEYLAATSEDQTVTVWSIEMDSQPFVMIGLGKLEGWGEGVTSLAFFPDGERVLSTQNRRGDLQILGLDGSVELCIGSGEEYTVHGAISPDGRMIAATRVTKHFPAPDIPYPVPPPSWFWLGDMYELFAEWDEANTLYEGCILVWDAYYGAPALRMDGQYVHTLEWNPGKPSLLAVGDYSGVRILDTDEPFSGPVAQFLTGGWVGSMAWSPSGELLAVGLPSRVEVWDPWRPGIVAVEETWRYPYALSWSPDGRWLASLSGYDLRYDEGGLPEDWPPRRFAKLVIWNLSISVDGSGLLILHDQAVVPRDGDIYLGGCLAWSPDSTRIAVATGSVRFWTVPSRPSRLESLGFHGENGVMVWSLEPGAGLVDRPFLGSPGRPLSCVAWSPDCTTILAGSNDGAINLWRTGPPCPAPVGEAPTLPILPILAISLLLSLLPGHPNPTGLLDTCTPLID